MKNFIKEFKEFAIKGNVIDMAIGVMIASAFGTIVASFTENIINPIIGILFTADLSAVGITLFDGKVFIGIGAFISSIINFLILALILFMIIRTVNKVRAAMEKPVEEEAPAEPEKSDELKALEQIVELLKKEK